MGTSTNQTGPGPATKGRPSLLEPGVTVTEHNILDVMGNDRSKPSTINRTPRAIWLMIPLLAAAAWAADLYWRQAGGNAQAPSVASAKSQPIAAGSPAPQNAASSNPAMPSSEAGATVLIAAAEVATMPITAETSPAAKSTAPTGEQANALPAPSNLAAVPAPTADPASGSPATPSKKLGAAASTSKAVSQQPSKAQKQARQKTSATLAEAPKRPVTEESGSIISPRPNESDPDVELISALLKHRTPDAGAYPAPIGTQPSIADLVASCQKKSSAQSLQCQRRICEGSWGKAQACPMSKAPKSAKVAKVAP